MPASRPPPSLPPERHGAPHPAVLGAVWKALAALAIPALGAALVVWRDAALMELRLDAAQAALAQVRADLTAHLADDAARRTAQDREGRDVAVAQARVDAALAAVRLEIDTLLAALQRRRGG